jgi:hypothetical protein
MAPSFSDVPPSSSSPYSRISDISEIERTFACRQYIGENETRLQECRDESPQNREFSFAVILTKTVQIVRASHGSISDERMERERKIINAAAQQD